MFLLNGEKNNKNKKIFLNENQFETLCFLINENKNKKVIKIKNNELIEKFLGKKYLLNRTLVFIKT